jgi:hypothetical protein
MYNGAWGDPERPKTQRKAPKKAFFEEIDEQVNPGKYKMATSQNGVQVDGDQDTFITAQNNERVDQRKGKLMATQKRAREVPMALTIIDSC